MQTFSFLCFLQFIDLIPDELPILHKFIHTIRIRCFGGFTPGLS